MFTNFLSWIVDGVVSAALWLFSEYLHFVNNFIMVVFREIPINEIGFKQNYSAGWAMAKMAQWDWVFPIWDLLLFFSSLVLFVASWRLLKWMISWIPGVG